MRQSMGILLQLAVLALLPLLIYQELAFGFPLIVMPICLLIGTILFFVGTRLRKS